MNRSKDRTPGRLTGREHEVLLKLSEGLSTQEIADKLFISHVTVRNHVARILVKLHVHSRLAAVAFAMRSGLLSRRSRSRR